MNVLLLKDQTSFWKEFFLDKEHVLITRTKELTIDTF